MCKLIWVKWRTYSCNRLAISARAPNSNEIIAENGAQAAERETLLNAGASAVPRIVEAFERDTSVEETNNGIDWSKGWNYNFLFNFISVTLLGNRL